jgi:hypothetical protein
MYSRLYTHILNHFPQVDHCASFHHIYADSSLFGLFASFFPAGATNGQRGNAPAQILPHLAHQLSLLLYSPIPTVELARARNQLKSSLMMALESRAVEVEDLGRQVRSPTIRRVGLAEHLCSCSCTTARSLSRRCATGSTRSTRTPSAGLLRACSDRTRATRPLLLSWATKTSVTTKLSFASTASHVRERELARILFFAVVLLLLYSAIIHA